VSPNRYRSDSDLSPLFLVLSRSPFIFHLFIYTLYSLNLFFHTEKAHVLQHARKTTKNFSLSRLYDWWNPEALLFRMVRTNYIFTNARNARNWILWVTCHCRVTRESRAPQVNPNLVIK